MRRAVAVSVALLFVASTLVARAQDAQTQSGSTGDRDLDAALAHIPKAETYRLANGLQVVLQPLPGQHRVAVAMSYHVGLRDDPLGLRGLSHVVQHMTYRGSRHIEPYGIARLLDSAAGVDAGELVMDSTSYVDVVPSTALATALWAESERMAFTAERFSASSLQLERRTMQNEYRRRITPEMAFEQQIRGALLGETHPYANAIEEDLRHIEITNVQAFFDRYYRPANATLILAGGMDPAAARLQIARYFDTVANPASELRRDEVPGVAPKPAHRITVRTALPVTRFAARWLMLDLSQREAVALRLLAGVMQRRLGRALLDQDRATRVDVRLEVHPRTSIFAIDASLVAAPDLGPLEYALREHIEQLWSSDLSAELDSAKNAAILHQVSLFDDPLALVRAMTVELDVRGKPVDLQAEVQSIRSIEPSDLLALRARFLHPMFAWLEHARPRRATVF